jgi:hypothetical protein
MIRRRSAPLVLSLAAAALLGAGAQAKAQAPAPIPCIATFHVLHDDVIGDLELPEGQYRLAVDGITCARASHLLTQFLEDWDGVLPRPWGYTVHDPGQGTFSGRGTFTVTRTGDATTPGQPGSRSAGGGSHGDLVCPATFDVLHDDRVGRLRIPAGDYTITLLGGNLTCATASRLFSRFLKRPSGRLPRRWVVLPQTAEFMRFSSHHGFRIKPAA